MDVKRCTKCKQIKPVSEFYPAKSAKDGLHYYCKLCCIDSAQKWIQNNPSRARETQRKIYIKKHYDMTIEEYNVILENQGGVCLGCGSVTSNGKSLSVDHEHKTGKIRGLLCNSCNLCIGYAKDNPDTLRRLADYLEESFK